MICERGHDSCFERRLFTLDLGSPSELPGQVNLPSRHFVCLLAWDARGVSVDTVSSLVESLLLAGAAYFVCWGPDCERVHDIIDEVVVEAAWAAVAPAERCIMTTWHDSEPLSEAIRFLLVNAVPSSKFEEATGATLAISIGCADWAAELARAMDHPREFVADTAEDDGA